MRVEQVASTRERDGVRWMIAGKGAKSLHFYYVRNAKGNRRIGLYFRDNASKKQLKGRLYPINRHDFSINASLELKEFLYSLNKLQISAQPTPFSTTKQGY
jgi:hypothetical protein